MLGKALVTAGLFIGIINLLVITSANALFYSHFEKGLQKAKQYEIKYQDNKKSENNINGSEKSLRSNLKSHSLKKAQLKPRGIVIDKEFQLYFNVYKYR